MAKPQNARTVLLIALILSVSSFAQAQRSDTLVTPTTALGIHLYHQGKTEDATRVLLEVVKVHKGDADAWYYLGLAQYSQGWMSGARTSFEKTVKLRPDLADAHAKLAYALILASQTDQALASAKHALELGDQGADSHYAIAEANLRNGQAQKALEETAMALTLKPDFLPALITKSFAHYSLKQFPESAASLERFLSLAPDDPDAQTWRDQLEELQNQSSQQPDLRVEVFRGIEMTEKARVLSKPEPAYTEQARKAGVTGTVVLRAIFASDGEVKHILISRALGYGLTTAAIKAARRIKFTPALKEGKPVSQYIQLEYNFNLY